MRVSVKSKYIVRAIVCLLVLFFVLWYFVSISLSILLFLVALCLLFMFLDPYRLESFELRSIGKKHVSPPEINIAFKELQDYHLINISLLKQGDHFLALGRLTNLGNCRGLLQYLLVPVFSTRTISYTVAAMFDKNLNKVQDWVIVEEPKQSGFWIQGAEDYRLFEHDGHVYSSGTIYLSRDPTSKHNTLARPVITEWKTQQFPPRIENQQQLQLGDLPNDEKNWGAFTDSEGQLLFIRNMSPYEVIKLEGENIRTLVKTSLSEFENLRGGRLVGRLENGLNLGMCHQIRPLDRTYFLHFFLFSSTYPYTITKMTDRLSLFHLGGHEFQYPHSAILHGDKIILCVSVDDCQTYFVIVNLREVLDKLK